MHVVRNTRVCVNRVPPNAVRRLNGSTTYNIVIYYYIILWHIQECKMCTAVLRVQG